MAGVIDQGKPKSNTKVIEPRFTLQRMAKTRTKSVPEPVASAFREQLRLYVEREHDGNQSSAARALGFTQSHVSSLMSGSRKIGLPILLHLRERTGRSIDEWLGLAPSMDAVRAVIREELARERK